ncbi:hypothetical protein [Engelhardtia mirabilis]|uniref:Uncharacterized protein n=1 Tax=Engelhardtia mirabilis TaxID=2528011 RepID=A0A518BKS1_9BACT|nr:hypothetical protein Pla133_26310 [Planctomycetes bacterium Pla133]QDV01869.1 hypothetical protein Pla86_26300 [Planctomycetes bacterium Pla86]
MTHHPIERGVELLRELVADDPQLEAELLASRVEFFGREPAGDPESPERVLAERRHAEWFLFERSTRRDGEPPWQVLQEQWEARADGELASIASALMHSRTGVFEVGDVEPGVGLWLHDLLGHGVFAVHEAEASAQLRTGDVLAGRIFPCGDSQFRLSPAMACFRNQRLLEALRSDLGSLRTGRRGTLRVAQLEIERMFFGRSSTQSLEPTEGVGDYDSAEAPSSERQLTAELLEVLVEGGVERERAEAWVESLRGAAKAAGPAAGTSLRGDLLDQLAFETQVDLDRARAIIGEAWIAFAEAVPESAEAMPESAEAVPENEQPDQATTNEVETKSRPPKSGASAAVARALENFDRGRAAGQDLDQLFDALEGELGLDDEDEHDLESAPDFPGVIAAVIEEYLWETSQESPVSDHDRRTLDALGRYARALGVLEDLGPEHLTSFATLFATERGLIPDGAAARKLLSTLERFARWVEEAHHSPLWTSFERRYKDLVETLPRTADANQALGSGGVDVGSPERHPVEEDLSLECLGLRSDNGWLPLEAPSAALKRIRVGDQVAADTSGDAARVLRVYAPATVAVDPASGPTVSSDGAENGDDDGELDY